MARRASGAHRHPARHHRRPAAIRQAALGRRRICRSGRRARWFQHARYAEADARRALAEAEEESNRLLYVALTRAEGPPAGLRLAWQQGPAGCWYEKIAAGFGRLEGVAGRPFQPEVEGRCHGFQRPARCSALPHRSAIRAAPNRAPAWPTRRPCPNGRATRRRHRDTGHRHAVPYGG